MPKIIPNWHPMFVHYSIALLNVATLLFIIGKVMNKPSVTKAVHINLWLGAVITIGTVIAGLSVASTAGHDAKSHAQMINHRDWAIPTAINFIALTIWLAWKYRQPINVSWRLILLMALTADALLSATKWYWHYVIARDSSGEGYAGHNHPVGRHTSDEPSILQKMKKN